MKRFLAVLAAFLGAFVLAGAALDVSSSPDAKGLVLRYGAKICLDGSACAVAARAVSGRFQFDSAAKFNSSIVVGSHCTGTVATAAVTCNGVTGIITDDGTDIDAAADRAITLTNSYVAATSAVMVTTCSALTAASTLSYNVVAGAGSATINIHNPSAADQTAIEKFCFVVLN